MGVPQNATLEIIKKVYVALVKQYHPDRAGSSDESKQNEYNECMLAIMASKL